MVFTLFDNKTVIVTTGISEVFLWERDNNSKKYKYIDRVFVNRVLIEEVWTTNSVTIYRGMSFQFPHFVDQ